MQSTAVHEPLVCVSPRFGTLELWSPYAGGGWEVVLGHSWQAHDDVLGNWYSLGWSCMNIWLEAGPEENGREILGEL